MTHPLANAILIADLGYGDAGKGSIVDALARETSAHSVVRYNGGAQAAHNVITPDGRQHTFAQFGSASFVPGVRTHLSRYMILHPFAILSEERHLRSLGVTDAFARTSIERSALVISPYQQAANRLKEIARGDVRHGSCGLGVGETMADWLEHGEDMLCAADLEQPGLVVRKLRRIRDIKLAQLQTLLPALQANPQAEEELKVFNDPNLIKLSAEVFAHFASQVRIVGPEALGSLLCEPGGVLFEGAQGVLLDEWWGFFPYNTWSTLTFKNADALLTENNFDGPVLKLGLLRGYATRHGAGPFVSEDPALTAAMPDMHNLDNPWQRAFRVGYLDLLALRYALQVTGQVDALAVTNLDRMESMPDWQVCTAYHYPGSAADLEGDFEHQGQTVTAILPPSDPTDLRHQEWLTQRLMAMRPIYSPCERSREVFLRLIEDALGPPIAVTSDGPTALDKQICLPAMAQAF
jgi:adenylosuccinate synthase